MDDKNYNLQINFDLSYYQIELRKEMHSHIITLQILIDTLKRDFDLNNKKISLGILGIEMPLITNDNDSIIINEINKTFISAIRTFQNFIDKLIAVIELFKNKIRAEYNIHGQKEFDIFLNNKLETFINKVSTDRSLNFPKKLNQFNLEEQLNEILLGYSTLRNNLEHHKDVSSKETILKFYVTSLYVDNLEMETLNQILKKGSTLEVRGKIIERIINKGEKVKILENEIFEIIFTLSEIISLHFINSTYEILNKNNQR
ncbi:MAG: hypothetical protein ABNG98_00735 [Flavobacterium sp.]|jgi:hypothetical protein